MRFLPAAALLLLALTAACGDSVECGTDPRGTLTFSSCAELDQERAEVLSPTEAAMLDRCYADQCAADEPAAEGE